MSEETNLFIDYSNCKNLTNFDLVYLGSLLQKRIHLTEEIDFHREALAKAERELQVIIQTQKALVNKIPPS